MTPGQDDGRETVAAPAARPGSALIQVALATFNSERFLAEQLDSLFGQTCQDFTILVSDDGSSDTTLAIIADYQRRYPNRIGTLAAGEYPHGPAGNYARIIAHLSADYAVFCDHDDVWLLDKIALSLERMRLLEARHGAAMPLLVHTDLMVVGPDLEVLFPSLFDYVKYTPAGGDLRELLMGNPVAGCTTMVNRALYELARPVPAAAMMHDYWLALLAATAGHIGRIDAPTILYRQHGGNFFGVVRRGTRRLVQRSLQTLFRNTRGRLLEQHSDQAEALLSRCADGMSLEQRRLATTLANLWSISRWRRARVLWREGLLHRGLIRNVALCIAVTRHGARHRAAPALARTA